MSEEYPNFEEENASIVVKNLVSAEHYKKDGKLIPLLNDISFNVAKGDKVGISASSKEELLALIEILGNMRSYYKGKVRLSSFGTKADKKTLVEQLFYVDSPAMLYEDMNLLEHLMFIANIKAKAENRSLEAGETQKSILDYIRAAKMEKYVLTPVRKMNEEVQFIVAVMVALMSDSEKIIINASKYSFTYEDSCSLQLLFSLFEKKTVVFGTFDNKVIGMSCNKVIYIVDGKLKAYATVDDLYKNWDNVTCSFKTEQTNMLSSLITKLAWSKKVQVAIENNYVYVKYLEPADFIDSVFFRACQDQGIVLSDIHINHGRVANAFEEIRG
jgi:ABC-type multidrug transport system ATPase subunit